MLHRVVERDADLTALRDTWDALLATQSRACLPLSWEWFSAWWQCFRDGEPGETERCLNIHVFEGRDGPMAIVPMLTMRSRFRHVPVRVLTTMANGHSPLWDAVLHVDLGTKELEEIGRTLLASPDIDVWQFRRIAADSRLLAWLHDQASRSGRVGLQETVRIPLVHSRGRWQEYLDSRSRKYRRNTLRKVRNYATRPGATVEHVQLRSGREPVLKEVEEISRRSWKVGVGNDLGTSRNGRKFLVQLLDLIGPRGDASVWLARIDGRAIAYELHVRGGGITYPIRADIDESWRELTPGSVLEYYALESAFEDPEVEIYDTCAANYWYLRNLSDEAREIHDVEYFPRRVKSTALYLLEYGLLPPLRRLRNRLRPAPGNRGSLAAAARP